MELVVIIAILGTLLALIAAAVQNVRAAAACSHCKNNLHQLGVALHDYHGLYKTLPPGVTGPAGKDSLAFVGWQARLLPFLDQGTLWQQTLAAYAETPIFNNRPPHPSGVVIPAFGCPSDTRTASPSRHGNAFTSYVGVEGTNQYRHDGLLFLDSQIRFEQITDGLSNTLMVGERPPSANEVFGWWYAGWGQDRDGSAEMLLGVEEHSFGPWSSTCPPGPSFFGPGSFQNQCDLLHFWSPHAGGAHFLFADGSARFLSYGAAPLMPALATRAGGDAATLPD